jgi:lipopolysaccharide export LptBFGC system permease protein LptF
VVFYVLVSAATILGERQIIPALVAAWIPNLVMLGMSFRLYAKAR